MKFYLKQALLPTIYIVFGAFTAAGIISMNESLVALKIVLLVLNLALYAVVVSFMAMKDGEEALKVRLNNDIQRRMIIETGEDRPLKIKEEYKPWKGFVNGLIACAPLIILLLIHTVMVIFGATEGTWASAISSFIYFMISAFSKVGGGYAPWQDYFTLIAIPFVCLCTGIPYILGAKKIERQQEKIKAQHKKIYGDK